jgi:hypothetical protein
MDSAFALFTSRFAMAAKQLFCTRCGNLLTATSESASQSTPHSAVTATYVFECQACRLVFQVAQQEMAPAGQAQERRNAPRVPVQVPVDLECGPLVGEGTVTDISKGGCAVESQQPLTIGQLLRLKFPPPTGSVDNCATMKIATVQNLRGQKAGMKFLAFTPEEQSKLTKTITKSIQFYPPSDKRP